MHRTAEHLVFTALVLTIGLLLASAPAKAVEDGLFGVRIGASYRQLVEDFGTPHGILFPSGSGLVFQTTSPAALGAGLPDFSQQTAQMPVYVLPIRASVLEANQVQWTYNLRDTKGIAIGIVLKGEGADAIVSDVVVAGFPKYLKGKSEPVRTAKGVVLQSTFEEVVKKYGYPPLIEIYPPSVSTPGAARGAGGAMRAGGGRGGMRAGGARGGMRGGMRGGGMRGGGRRGGMRGGGRRGGMRGRGRAEAPDLGTEMRQAGSDSLQIVLTAAPGRRGGRRGGGMRGGGMRGGGMRGGGMRGGGMRGGGMRGGMRGGGMRGGRGGRTTLPPLGTRASGPEEQFTATAVVDHQAITFSRSCLMIYEGIAFTLHDMRVYRIHVSE
jgi:hypothetical protein